MSKGRSQSIERRMDLDVASISSNNSIYWQLISVLGKTYCLSDINISLCKQNMSADKSSLDSERKHMNFLMGSNTQNQIKESFNSSSNNKASSSQPRHAIMNSSQPGTQNGSNNNWFNILTMPQQSFLTPMMKRMSFSGYNNPSQSLNNI